MLGWGTVGPCLARLDAVRCRQITRLPGRYKGDGYAVDRAKDKMGDKLLHLVSGRPSRV